MAVFIEIRKRFGTLIVLLIGGGLALFVLETALNSNSNLLKGNNDIVGVIDGDKIHYKDYNDKVDEITTEYKLNATDKNIDDNTLFSLREQAWNQLIQDHINNQEFSALGVEVPDEEFKDLFYGADPYPAVKKSFTDPRTGQFNPMNVRNYVNNLDKPSQQAGDDPVERRTRWISFENAVRDDRLNTKYKSLIKDGLYVPKWQAEMDYNDKERKVDISYIKVPYTVISDSAVKVNDAEMQAYIDAHKEQYKQEESRKVEYVIFSVKPSADDTAKARKYVTDAYHHLVENPNDTNFIKLNADNSLDKLYYDKSKVISQKAKDSLMDASIGTVFSPYFEDGAYKTAKLMDRKNMPDSVKFSLIFISKGSDSTKAKFKTDSIFGAIKSGADFADEAQKFSDDKNTGAKGGDQGYIKQGRTFKALDDFLFFGGAVGDVKTLNIGNAFAIVKITEAPAPVPAIQYAIVSRKVEASSATDKAVYELANKFASANSSAALFTSSFTAPNTTLNKQTSEAVRKSDFQLPGLTNARELVKWAYTSNVGDISTVFALDQNYVVAYLVGAKQEGTQQLTPEIKPQIEADVRREKKGAQIAAQLNASLSLNATLESIAAKMGQEVKNAPNVNFSAPYLPNLGAEPKLVGTVCALKVNQISKPVIGANGVYVAKVTTISDPKPIADYTPYKQQDLQSVAPMIEYSLAETQKKMIKIEDDRYKFF